MGKEEFVGFDNIFMGEAQMANSFLSSFLDGLL
jgi:hypothetical protein